MNGSLDPQLMSVEGERMQQVLRQLEGFVPSPEEAKVRLPRLSTCVEEPQPPAEGSTDKAE